MATFFAIKDPDAILDYGIDWTNWLTGTDTLVTSTWSAPTGLTIVTTTITAGTALAYISGGTIGEVYDVSNKITTAQARTEERSILFTCIDR